MARPESAKLDQDIMREVLAALRSGYNLKECCDRVGIDPDNKLRSLRRKYKDFDNHLKELRWGAGRVTGKNGKGGTEYLRTAKKEWGAEFEDARVESFILTFRDTKDRDAAARSSGFLPSTVMAMLDPTSKKFHPEFARAMREEEIREGWSIEDDLRRQARDGDAVSQRWWLERRVPEYGQRAKSATDANDMKYNADTLKKTMQEMRSIMADIRNRVGIVAEEPEHGSEDLTEN